MENDNNTGNSVHVVDVVDQQEIKRKKTITIVIVALAVVLLVAALITGFRNRGDSPVDTTISTTTSTSTAPIATTTTTTPSTVPTETTVTVVPVVVPTTTVEPQASTDPVTVPTTVVTTTAAPVDWRATDPSTWTAEQVVTYYVESVNLCKAYTGALTVNHNEQFEAEVLDCTGGDIAKYVANKVVENMAKPTSDVYQFNGGTAVDSEGNTTTLLLPLEGNCVLPMEGIKSATAVKNGDSISVTIILNEELTTIDNKVPPYNSTSIGYIQLTEIYKYLDMTKLDITYFGSSIEATIRPDGYISSATYKIPIQTVAGGKKGPLTGTATFTATQQEVWELLWA